MTQLWYLPDADDVTSFRATVTEATSDAIVLDGTYFYPEGGGQPADHGTLSWAGGSATVTDVYKDHGNVRHDIELRDGEVPAAGTTVDGEIDKQRRRRLSRMHTAQHVVSRVVLDSYGAATVGSQIGLERSSIDFEPASFDDTDLDRIETRSNEIIERNLTVHKENRPREAVENTVDDGRSQIDLIPDAVDPLRVIAIEEFDMCPCGGTHVSQLGAIGQIEITDCTSTGDSTERIEFKRVDSP